MKRLFLFPDTTKIINETLTIAGRGLDSLVETYRTQLHSTGAGRLEATGDLLQRDVRLEI